MNEIQLKGTYHEMGLQHGKLLRGMPIFNEPTGILAEKRRQLADQCEKIIDEYCPGITDHLRGFAEGGNFEYDEVKIVPFCLNFLSVPIPSCTIATLSGNYTQNAQPLFIRSYDWDYTAETYSIFYHTHLSGGLENYGFCDIWGSRYGGVNQEGLTIAITGSPSYKGPPQPGISMNILVWWILDHFTTVAQVVEFLNKVPHLSAFNFMVMDKNGNMAQIVVTHEQILTSQSSTEFFTQTNHFQSEEMSKYAIPGFDTGSSAIRLENIQKWICQNKSSITPESALKFIQTPVTSGGICDHGQFGEIIFGTIWAWVYDYEKEKLYYFPGSPSKNEVKCKKF